MGNHRTDRASRPSLRQQPVRQQPVRQQPVRQQPVRQQPARQQRRSKIDQTASARQRSTSLHLWLKLFQRHSALLLIVTWAILLGTAIAAVTAIVNPDVSVRPPALQAKVGSSTDAQRLAGSDNPPVQRLTKQRQASRRSQSASGSPLSAGGALLLSCAGGCLLLSRCLQPQSIQRPRRRVAQHAPEPQAEPYQSEPYQSGLYQPESYQSASSDVDPVSPTSDAAAPHWPNDSTIASARSKIRPSTELTGAPAGITAGPALPVSPVSILPADQNHPLDWDEPSLADSLDLRQKRPLSYWLRG